MQENRNHKKHTKHLWSVPLVLHAFTSHPLLGGRLDFLDSSRLTTQFANVIELCATDAA